GRRPPSRSGGAAPGAAGGGGTPAAVRGRRLRGLLLLARPRQHRGPDLPPWLAPAAAQLAAPAGRVPPPGPAGPGLRPPAALARARPRERPAPVLGPTRRLDFGAGVGFVIGVGCPQGTAVAAGEFAQHAFGFMLVNDWSARDIQSWETQPLGPFLGKSFATSL